MALLDSQHFGTRATYNHERYEVVWSPNNRFFVESQSWKWYTASASLYLLDDNGAITSSMDLMPAVKEQLRRVAEQDHKVARKRFKEHYGVSLWKQAVDLNGHVTIGASAEVPKSDKDPSVSLLIQFTANAASKGKLSIEGLEVQEKEEEME